MKIMWICLSDAGEESFRGFDGGLANASERAGLIGLANRFEQTEEWVQVAPEGQFDHSRGIQLIDDRPGRRW
jgi:hypothetical protein